MAFGKPKKSSYAHAGTQFYTKEGLIAMGILSESFSPRVSRSPSEHRAPLSNSNPTEPPSEKEAPADNKKEAENTQKKPIPTETFTLNRDFCRSMNICQRLSYSDMDRLRKTLMDFFHAKGAWVDFPRKGVNFELYY